jgi:hypothetical protein
LKRHGEIVVIGGLQGNATDHSGRNCVVRDCFEKAAKGLIRLLRPAGTNPRVRSGVHARRADATIGAGDALAAALLWSQQQGNAFEETLRWGVAAGTASAKLPGMSFASLEQTREMLGEVDLRQVHV